MTSFLPYGRQSIEDDDVAAIAAALRDDYLTTGPTVAAFETVLAAATGAPHAVVCNSGTAALHLAALAMGLGQGDVAVVPSITFLATANAVRFTGAEVVFADVDRDTGLMTADHLADAIRRCGSGRPRAVLPVHLNGQLADLIGIQNIADRQGFTIIEDACHALGLPDVGAARHGGLACFSTHPVKAIATGEGGFVTTANAHYADRMFRLRSHGMQRHPAPLENAADAFDGDVANPWYYEMPEIGWNYRLPDVLCALGISQIKKLDAFQARRRALATRYDQKLAALSPMVRPVPRTAPHGWHLYALLVDFDRLGMTRRGMMEALRREGIGTQVHYFPVHRQPYYAGRYGSIELPGAEAYYARCLSIPFYPTLSDADQDRVVQALTRIVNR